MKHHCSIPFGTSVEQQLATYGLFQFNLLVVCNHSNLRIFFSFVASGKAVGILYDREMYFRLYSQGSEVCPGHCTGNLKGQR